MRNGAILCLLAALYAPAVLAQSATEMAYQRAIANCLTNYHQPQVIPDLFRATGFTVSSEPMGLVAEGNGVWVSITIEEAFGGNACNIQAEGITAARGEQIARQLAVHFFGDKVTDDGPEGREECPAASIYARRNLMVMRFYDAGNGGVCVGGGGASTALTF